MVLAEPAWVTDPSRLSPGEEDLELLRELPLAHPKGGGWVAPFRSLPVPSARVSGGW